MMKFLLFFVPVGVLNGGYEKGQEHSDVKPFLLNLLRRKRMTEKDVYVFHGKSFV